MYGTYCRKLGIPDEIRLPSFCTLSFSRAWYHSGQCRRCGKNICVGGLVDTDVVKQQVWALADELNGVLGVPLIEPDQQSVKKENISLKGATASGFISSLPRAGT